MIALIVFLVLFFVIVRFARVKEGTAIALTSFGEFTKIIFRWKDHWMDTEWNIWRELKPGEEPEEGSENKQRNNVWSQKVFKGLIIYFWPFQRIHRYNHRWTDIRLQQAEMNIEFHEEELNYALLKPVVYAFKLVDVETLPPERIPVTVVTLVTLRVRNPYLFLFVAPPTPIEDTLARISAETRALITSCDIDTLLKLKGEFLWDLLKEAKVIESTAEKWGIKLADKGIEIREIIFPPDYQKAITAKKVQELIATGRAEQIMGTIISNIVTASGKDRSSIQQDFLKDPQAFYQAHQATITNTMNKLAMEEGAYFKSEIVGGSVLSGEIISLLGAFKKILPGLLEKGSTKEPAETKEGKTERGKPAKPKPTSILANLSKGLSKQKPRKLTEEEKARLRKELDSLPKEKKREWEEYVSRLIAGGYLEM